MSASPKLIVLCNPLLDIQATVDQDYLNKYSLKANDAILVDAKSEDAKMAIYDELASYPDVKYIAGGAGQNSARGVAYMLGKDQVAYFGSVGQDKYADKLAAENEAAGVTSLYQIIPDVGTGKCAALITGHDRSLVTDLGAANSFTPDHLDKHWSVIEAAKLFYVSGFHLTVSKDAVIKLGKHAKETGKPFILNLSAPFILQFFKQQVEDVLPYTTMVVANESEAAAYAESFGLTCDKEDLAAVAKAIVGDSEDRTVVFTHGLEPTIVVTKNETKSYPVKPLESSKIVDTNGAGDAFAAGMLAGLTEGKPLEKSIDMGQWLAALSIQEIGAAYPKEKLQYSA
ncbi:hypothetical protein Kpol_1013p60 [Vanderwaltozyma polyspora DSM 70294]|uniref:Adenosine kinase n=1 Tax=Vanderwaltozyma polyspora (strain ATCC 22028 / DSM 70294 / BCRC 21397 / CBS 2163 / NBRC 10782 / NRRL Y-8283 / UCD 57-17) TaxID=436907 RepID=A7THA7_VANPO|nr:uncharacterized protein Kpol_1013p60 [Vanderwaltozyma polyspora DSM 70294]EDO18388.1 hypothetical protein Kpol_1013p60 [Vanderwaltozyma polyspora DSM 70294]